MKKSKYTPSIYWCFGRFFSFRCQTQATYEATFHVAIQNYHATGNNILYLTLVGGNAFGNPSHWIFDAIRQSLDKFSDVPLDVRMVSYKRTNPETTAFIRAYTK